MPISGTTTDYTNRLKDLYISQGINATKVTLQPVTYSFGSVSSYIAGVQKLVQRYIITLLNSSLIIDLQSARSSNIQEAVHIFNLASWNVIQEFKDYQNEHPEVPEDEQLSTAQLTDISSSSGRLNISVQLVTKAGEIVPFVLPVALS